MKSDENQNSGENLEDDFELMVERLLSLLESYAFGAKAELIRQKYEEKYSTKLPQHWLRTLKDVPEIDVTGLGSIVCLCAAKPKTENPISTNPRTEPATVTPATNPQSVGGKKKVRLAMNLMEEKIFDVAQHETENTDTEISPPANDSKLPALTLNVQNSNHHAFRGVNVSNGRHKAKITSWTSCTNFGIRLVQHDQQFFETKAELSKVYNSPTESVADISTGNFLVARFKGEWSRALALTGDTEGRIRALLVDSAVAALIPTSEFRVLRSEFRSSPALGLHAVATETDPQLDAEIRKRMSESDNVVVEINVFSSHQMKEGVTEVSVQISLPNFRDKVSTNGHSVSQPQRSISAGPKPKIPDNLRNSPRNSPDLPRLLPLTKFRDKKTFEVVPVFAPDPSEFTVIPTQCYPLYSSYIKDRLSEAAEDVSLELREDEPQIGGFYAGFDDETNEWRRVYYSGPVSLLPGMLKVFLVDSGEFRFMTNAQLRQLPKALMDAPEFMLAVKCELVGVAPVGGKARLWASDASDQFRARAEGQLMVVEPVGEMEMWQGENCPDLPKLNVKMRDEKGNDFAEWLINNGFAVKAPMNS